MKRLLDIRAMNYICTTPKWILRSFSASDSGSLSQHYNKGKVTDTKDPTSQNNESVAVTSDMKEYGGPSGPEPTRYGDWEKNGRCYDF